MPSTTKAANTAASTSTPWPLSESWNTWAEPWKPDTIEAFDIQVEARIARGQAYAYLGDTDEGYKQLDTALADAEREGCVGLALEARLGRVEVLIALAAPDADKAQRALIADARKQGFGRIAHLTETIAQR